MKQMLCLLRKRIFSSRITHALFYDVLVDGVKGSLKPLIYRTCKTRDYVAMLYQLKVLLCYPIIRCSRVYIVSCFVAISVDVALLSFLCNASTYFKPYQFSFFISF